MNHKQEKNFRNDFINFNFKFVNKNRKKYQCYDVTSQK